MGDEPKNGCYGNETENIKKSWFCNNSEIIEATHLKLHSCLDTVEEICTLINPKMVAMETETVKIFEKYMNLAITCKFYKLHIWNFTSG